MTDIGLPPGVRMRQLISGFAVSQALYVVAELNIATALLAGPRTVSDLATELAVDPVALNRLIRFVAPLGVFRIRSDIVEVTEFGKTLADGPARCWVKTHYTPFTELLCAPALSADKTFDRTLGFSGPAPVRAALEIINAEPRAALTTVALARRCHVSARTLQTGFRRHLSMSPMEYLRSVRLARAHDELRAADPSRETVTTIAQRWGFTNLSRFAQQHRTMFGETPAETLRTCPGRP